MNYAPLVLVDGRVFTLQSKGGVSQMWSYILASPNWHRRVRTVLLLYPGHEKNVHLVESGLLRPHPERRVLACPIPPSDNANWVGEAHESRRRDAIAAHAKGVDVVLATYYGENVLGRGSRYLVTAFDFAHEELPELIAKPSTPGVVAQKRRAFSEATEISFISNASRQRFFEHYPAFDRGQTHVVYLGHDPNTVRAPKSVRTVVHVGTRGAYKNFSTLAEAMHRLLRDDRAVRFLVMGGEAMDPTLASLREAFPEQVHFDASPSDRVVDLAMGVCGVYASASRYEGFGIPLLNAGRLGCHSVVSDIPVYREIAAPGTVFVPATVPGAFEEAIRSTFTLPRPRAAVWRTWDHVAQDYAELVCRVH